MKHPVKRADIVPEIPFSPLFLQGGLEQPTAQLLGLINQEDQHHQGGEDRTQVLLTQAKILADQLKQGIGVEGLSHSFPCCGGSRLWSVQDVTDIGFHASSYAIVIA